MQITLLFVLDVLIVSVLLVIGTLTLIKDSRSKLNASFFFLVLFTSFWIISNYLSNDITIATQSALLAKHLAFFFAGIAIIFVFLFVSLLIGKKLTNLTKSLISLGIAGSILGLTPFVVEGISAAQNSYEVKFGFLAGFYFTVLLLLMAASLAILIPARRKSTGRTRQKITIILLALWITLTILVVTNIILPLAFGYFAYGNLGPLSVIVFIAGLTYGIAKYRLFDLRVLIARSMGYVLSLGILISGFLVISYSITSFNTDYEQLINVALIVAIALTYQPVKKFFDRTTNRLFFHDSYDPQEFLQKLNGVMISGLGLEPLLINSARVVQNFMNSGYCFFWLKQASGHQSNYIGSSRDIDLSDELREKLSLMAKSASPLRIICLDRLDLEQEDLGELMAESNISVIAPLSYTSGDLHEEYGYLVLGPKRSGGSYTKDDTNVLEIAIDGLIIALQSTLRFEEIADFNVTLRRRIDEATAKLQDANTQLQKIDEQKDDFISMASHQLRTPLTSVKGYLSMVLDGDAGKITKTQRRMLDQAFVGASRMAYLIGDLLNVSRLRSGKFSIEPVSVDLAELINGEVNLLKETAKLRNLKLIFKKPKAFPALALDETKIRQVVMNFIDNAIHYTPEGGEVNVELVYKANNLEFKVTDDGIGVPKEEQHKLFTKFYRAGNAKKLRPDGTGLGLYMAKKVVIAHGGAVFFKSPAGERRGAKRPGSVFGFTISLNN